MAFAGRVLDRFSFANVSFALYLSQTTLACSANKTLDYLLMKWGLRLSVLPFPIMEDGDDNEDDEDDNLGRVHIQLKIV